METYQIITDEKALREYIDWLPDCQEHEQFYLTLFARKKYCPSVKWIKSDKGQLCRKTSKKEFIFDKIAQMECKLGAYKMDGNPVPQEALACYISVSPRDLWKATVRSIGQLAKVLECNGKNSNPHQEVMSEIQRVPGTRKFVMFDIDEKNDDVLREVVSTVDGYCDVVETRGGYHVFVRKDSIDKITDKMWYKKIANHSDVTGDAMSVPCGTFQGGHTPKFVYKYREAPYDTD
jgi:hypothetical protein